MFNDDWPVKESLFFKYMDTRRLLLLGRYQSVANKLSGYLQRYQRRVVAKFHEARRSIQACELFFLVSSLGDLMDAPTPHKFWMT